MNLKILTQKEFENEIKKLVKEKFPMLGGAVDQIFSTGSQSEDPV